MSRAIVCLAEVGGFQPDYPSGFNSSAESFPLTLILHSAAVLGHQRSVDAPLSSFSNRALCASPNTRSIYFCASRCHFQPQFVGKKGQANGGVANALAERRADTVTSIHAGQQQDGAA